MIDVLVSTEYGTSLSNAYASRRPFPYAILDGIWPVELLEAVRSEFPDPSDPRWYTYESDHESKKQEIMDDSMISPRTSEWSKFLTTDSEWIAFLEAMTGIHGLTGDLHGGGYHQILPGGKLDVHVDFNMHPSTGLYRRLNVLTYLNSGWTEADGGQLLLVGSDAEEAVVPIFGRTVVFSSSSTSLHGHPVPVAAGRVRRSFAVYYYSSEPPPGFKERHSAVWLQP